MKDEHTLIIFILAGVLRGELLGLFVVPKIQEEISYQQSRPAVAKLQEMITENHRQWVEMRELEAHISLSVSPLVNDASTPKQTPGHTHD